MERLFAGSLMQRCRTAFLDRVQDCRHALIPGEGPGKFLVELLLRNERITATVVEHSGGMIEQMRRRVVRGGIDPARVRFVQADALDWRPENAVFDLVATHFFLDCFPEEQLGRLIPRLAAATTPNALWLVSDFRLPESGWRRWRAGIILRLLYLLFRVTTGLRASSLTPPDELLRESGFVLLERRLENLGFAHADLWRRSCPTLRR